MTGVDDSNIQQQEAPSAATEHAQAKASRKRQADQGPNVLPRMEHFVWLTRKVKRPAMIHALLACTVGTDLPEIAGLVAGAPSVLPPKSRKQIFHAVAKMSRRVANHIERVAERVSLLDDEYGAQAVQSLLDPANAEDAAIFATPSDRHSRALCLYLRQEYPDPGVKADRRFDQAEHLQVMHRQWKSETFSSHYLGPKGVAPKIDPEVEQALRQRIGALYPKVVSDQIVIEHFSRCDLAHADRCGDNDAAEATPVVLHTLTATFNGSTVHFRRVEAGDVVTHEEDAAVSASFSWEPVSGALGVFSEDRENRRELASIFRDVVLACDGEISDMPMREFNLQGFSTPAILKRLEGERVGGIEKISILHITVARPFEQRTTDEARDRDIVQHLSSTLTIGRDRRDARNIYQIAYEDYSFDELTGYALSQVKLVFRMAKQPHRRAHNIAVQITAPNGLNDKSKTEEDRKRVIAQLARLDIVCEF